MMRQKFDPTLLLPAESYLRSVHCYPVSSLKYLALCYRRWIDLHNEWYPENGFTTEIYTGHINHTHLHGLEKLVDSLQELQDNKQYVKGWANKYLLLLITK